jgi:rod shape-determining protein MreC
MIRDRRRTGNPNVLLVVLIVVSFALMTFDMRFNGEGLVSELRTGAQTLASPLQDGSSAIVDPLVNVLDSMLNSTAYREELDRIRTENDELRLEVAETDRLRREVEVLEQILNLPISDIPETVAEVRGGTGPLETAFIITSGLNQGVVAGNPVLNPAGVLIGVVTEALEDTSIVTPVIAVDYGVDIVTPGEEFGVVNGLGVSSLFELTLLQATTPLLPEEILYTSGQTPGIPAGLPVAKVLQVIEPASGLIKSRSIEPLADPSTLTKVRVVLFQTVPIGAENPVEPEEETTETTVSG